MRILYLSHRIPYPPNKGDKIRSFHQVAQLARSHAVHLACLVDDPEDLTHIAALDSLCVSVDAVFQPRNTIRLLGDVAFHRQRPLSVTSFYSKELETRVHRRLASDSFDAVWVFSSAMAQYVPAERTAPMIVDFVDADSEKWRAYADRSVPPVSWFYRLEAKRLARFESEVARASAHVLFVSKTEAGLLGESLGDRPVSVVPNGVDLEYFQPAPDHDSEHASGIAFVGMMDYPPNVDAVTYFCREIFPHVRRQVPESTFRIIGRHPTRRVRNLIRPGEVMVTGSVPDVRPHLRQAALSVAPFRIARGVQNKVLESMAMGIPVVGTRAAFQGIDANEGDGVTIADEPKEFAAHVAALLCDPAERNERAKRARRYVERHHRWEDHGVALGRVLDEVMRASSERADHVRDRGHR